MLTTIIVALDKYLRVRNPVATLQVEEVAEEDILAPMSLTYVSDVLTEERRQAATEGVSSVYAPPIRMSRASRSNFYSKSSTLSTTCGATPTGTLDQKIADLNAITALTVR